MDKDRLKEQVYATIAAVQEEVALWWLIERGQQADGKQFYTGKEWVTSALQAARFATKDAAQDVIDHLVIAESAMGTRLTMRKYAYPVEHAFVNISAIEVQAATLRAVGEALLLHAGHATDQDITNLCNGTMPEGWEKGR